MSMTTICTEVMLRKRSNEEWERCEIVFEGGKRNGEEKKAFLKIEL